MKATDIRPPDDLLTVAGDDLGYTDGSRIETALAGRRSSTEWSRAVFEQTSPPMRAVLLLGWAILGLRLGPRSDPRHVLGWPIVEETPDRTVLRTSTRLGGVVHLVVTRDQSAVTFATGIRWHRALGRVVWSAVAPVHRLIVRHLLTRAAA